MQVELAPHLSFRSLESGIPGPSRTWRKISLLSTYPMSFHFTFIYVLTVESESCAYIGITVIAFTFITAYGIDAVCIIRTRICTVQAFIVINTFAKSVTNKSDITLTFIRALWMGLQKGDKAGWMFYLLAKAKKETLWNLTTDSEIGGSPRNHDFSYVFVMAIYLLQNQF